jgi:hypothetical protein
MTTKYAAFAPKDNLAERMRVSNCEISVVELAKQQLVDFVKGNEAGSIVLDYGN